MRLTPVWLRRCFAFAMLLFALQAFALQAIPPLTSPVTDLTQTLSSQEQAVLANKLSQFAADKGSQVVVLIVPSTEPEAIEQYSIRVADEWKIGREKEDDGVIVLVAKNDRKMRIEVGYGLEGAIPDAYAKRIINEQLRPKFKQGDFYGGLDAATGTITGLIEGEDLPPPSQSVDGRSLFDLLPLIMFAAIITGSILRSIFGTFLGSAFNGGLIGGLAIVFGAVLLTAGFVAVAAFIFTLMMGSRGLNGYGSYPGRNRGGGFGNGGFGGGGFGGGGFGGMGGGFGGGGASGGW